MMVRNVFAGLAIGVMASTLNAQTVLLEYDSSTGMLPEDFGWFHEGRSLERTCPGNTGETCRFYGNLDQNTNGMGDNDGTRLPVGGYLTSRGGNVDNTFPASGYDFVAPAPLFEGYDVCYAPEPTGVSGAESYGEWIEFDDGGLNLQHQDTTGGNERTPFGATREVELPAGVCSAGRCTAGHSGAICTADEDCEAPFTNAPFDHDVLRLVGGDGNGRAQSLDATSQNRNEGKIKIKDSYPGNYTGGPITVVFKGAFGVKGTPDNTRVLFEYDVMTADGQNHTAFEFSHLWDNGNFTCNDSVSPDQVGACGKFVANNDGPIEIMNDVYADVYKFVEFRVACDADVAHGADPSQACTIWVTDCENGTILESTLPPGYVPTNNTGGGNDFRWGLISTADISLWVDKLEVLEGIVPPEDPPVCPLNCKDPAFDVRDGVGQPGSNGVVDGLDFTAFQNCVTGPTPDPDQFNEEDPGYISNECVCMDVNEDLAIDQIDFAAFQRCLGLSGSELLACDD